MMTSNQTLHLASPALALRLQALRPVRRVAEPGALGRNTRHE
jgi:hypothetical protein